MKKQLMKALAVSTAIVCGCFTQASAQTWNQTGDAVANAATKLGTTNAFPLNLTTNNVSRLVIDASGKVGVGTAPALSLMTLKGAGSTPAASWISSGAPLFAGFGETTPGNADFNLMMASAAVNARGVMGMKRARGTLAVPAAVVANDQLGSLLVSGFDGTNFQGSAAVDFFADGAIAAGSVPARISFVTGSSGATRVERLKIGSTGDIAANGSQFTITQSTGAVGIGTGNLNVTTGNVNVGAGNVAVANGSVGIGTTAPSVKLDVNSPNSFMARFNGGSNMYIGLFENNIYRGYLGSFAGNAADVDFGTGAGNNGGKLHLTTKAVPRLTVDSIGQIGIGTTTPTAQIDVFNNTVNRSLNIISSAANGQIANISTTVALNAANDLLQLDLPAAQGPDAQFIEASLGGVTTKFAVNSDGRVGIGGAALANVGCYIQKGTDAAPASGGYLVTGSTTGANISMDDNEIMARNNGAVSTLFLQNNGGQLAMCANAGNVTIGTTQIATGYKLSVNGKIIGTEVRVDALANWPDYVFSGKHKLLPLEDLEASINANKHLPGIPSAAEVKENGIMLGDMQTKTMEKVEELTLYLIQLSKENKELKARLEKLENK